MAMADNFRNLPIGELVANPLIASAESQHALVGTYLTFINGMFSKDGDRTVPKTLDMEIERPVYNPDTKETAHVRSTIKAPLLGLVPIPALFIKSVDVEFSMEVKSSFSETESSKSEAKLEAEASISFAFFSASAKFSGSMSSQRETTRSTDQTAKYCVKVHAENMEPPETLSRLLDLLNQTVEPIALGAPTGS